MAHMDIFNDNAFSLVSMVQNFTNQPYVPQYLKGDFSTISSTTRSISIESRDGVLTLIPVSERGTPSVEGGTEPRKLRYFDTVRLAKGDTIQAVEVANIRKFGTESELQQVMDVVAERSARLKDDKEVTLEYMRLGVLQGKFLNPKDGSVIYDWFSEFGVTQAPEVNFALGTASTDVPSLIRKEKRRIIKASAGAITPQTKVKALCGEEFYDKLINHASIKETYLNWQAAAQLRQEQGNVFESFTVAGVEFVDYRGTDDNSKVAIGTSKCIIYPVGVRDNLVHAQAPADEYMEFVNRKGQESYTLIEQDPATNKQWVRVECKAYPLMYCARPKTLGRGKA